ncbi:MAG: hypothetical protein H6560_03820 [Lewinellaceae bacterium]|nr:hypothetical protein [Lewinellaceae bacterium]
MYSSRAADGVILIETKTGSGAEGWGVQVNSTTNFNTVLKLPNYQNEFGFGGGENTATRTAPTTSGLMNTTKPIR